MTRRLLLLSLMLMLGAPAQAQTLSCPATAPPAWGIPEAKLREVLVLSPAAGQVMNEEALPIMSPTREWRTKGMLHQSWTMNADAPKFSDKIDCLYEGSERHLRLDASKVQQCTASSTIGKHAKSSASLHFRCT